MRSLMGFGFVLLSIILALSLGSTSAEQVKNEVNTGSSSEHGCPVGNITNVSAALSHAANATCNLNSTNLKSTTVLENLTVPENVSSKNKVVVNASSGPFETGPSGKAVFVIDNGVVPIKNAENTGQASINGASLMRAVDGTPHGYTTYYN